LALYTAQQGNNWGESVYVAGQKPREQNGSSWDRVSAQYFEALGTPIVEGRGFRESDTATSQHVAVVNEAFVKKFFTNGENPIGQHFGKDEPSHAGDYEIVGIAKDAKYQNASKPARAMFFVPLNQTLQYSVPVDNMVETSSMYMGTLILHVQGDPRNFESLVRQTLASIDPNLPPLTMMSFDDQIEIRYSTDTAISRLTTVFGILALLLASIGLYGLMAYQVARRTGEIGIRMALGADRLNIVRLVLRGAFSQVGIGLLIGIPLVFLSGKLLASQLFGVGSFAPAILATAIGVLATCAFVASLVPARRAAGVDPMKALRTE
jgi:predicted permease